MPTNPLNTKALSVADATDPIVVAAGLTRGALNAAALNAFAVEIGFECAALGSHRVCASFKSAAVGASGLACQPLVCESVGSHRIFTPFGSAAVGAAGLVGIPFECAAAGASQLINALECRAASRARIYNAAEGAGTGAHCLGFDSYECTAIGAALLGFDHFECAGAGAFRCLEVYDAAAVGQGRIANDLTCFELYRGVDGAIDFSRPWETFSAAPHESAALEPGHSYAFVLRARNDYNLLSQNIEAWSVVVDEEGGEAVDPPSSPEFSVAAGAVGVVAVSGIYDYVADDVNAADQWLVYESIDGSDPSDSTPNVFAMSRVDGLAKLAHTTEALAEGAVVQILVRVRRSLAMADSVNAVVKSAQATYLGPTAPSGRIYV